MAKSYDQNPIYWYFNVCCVAVGGVLFTASVVAGQLHLWFVVVVLALVNSPGLLLIIAVGMEESELSKLIDPKTQSWAFLFGDTFCISTAVGTSAYLWAHERSHLALTHTWWLPFAAIGAGIVTSTIFHNVLDAPNYRNTGEEGRLTSRSKLWHDRGTFFSLTATVFYFGLPVLASAYSYHHRLGWLVVGALGAFLVTMIGDGIRSSLDVVNLHPRMSKDWETIEKPLGVR